MIYNQWYAILESKEVPKNKVVGVKRLGEKLALWRSRDGQVHCVFDQCCHRGASLALGCLVEDEVECPFHGFLYDGTGKVTKIPANGKKAPVADRYKVHAYEVREAHGFIFLWYGDGPAPSGPIPFFESLKEGFVYKTFAEVWDVHYTRAAENQLDVVHLPFVHKTTIGKGNKTMVDGPVVKWDGNLMTFYVKNEVDDGSRVAMKSNEIKHYEDFFSLEFLMPHLWHNIISDKVRVFAAFAPIDEDHTMIYLRFYQAFANIKVIGPLIASISNVFNRIVLHQDRRVVLTQLPKKSELMMGENLIPGDLPIIEFRKKRDALKKESGQVAGR